MEGRLGGVTTKEAGYNRVRRARYATEGRCPCGAKADGYRCAKCKKIAADWQRKRRKEK